MDELERKCKGQQEQLFQVKEILTHTTAELKLRAARAEGEHDLGARVDKGKLELDCLVKGGDVQAA